jgi:hypothetical protein
MQVTQLAGRATALGPARRAVASARAGAGTAAAHWSRPAQAQQLAPARNGAHRRAAGASSVVARAVAAAAGVMGVDGLKQAVYISELAAACDAVRLASKLCHMVQRQLAEAEKVEKSDSSPVTVADYGGRRGLDRPARPLQRGRGGTLSPGGRAPAMPAVSPDAAQAAPRLRQLCIPSYAAALREPNMRLRRLAAPAFSPAGAQALVAWSLSRAFPGTTVSIVGEEDSADLRAPEGKAMLARITQLVNTVLAGVESSPQINEQQLIDLIGAPQRRAGL